MKIILSSLLIIVSSLFFSISDCLADEIGNELNNNYSMESKTNNINSTNNDENDSPNSSIEDIFGDEQAFPFIAGLGKNAAH